jgi:hypothetical protein
MLGSSLRVGSTLLIAGLILFSFGLLIALHQTIIVEDIMSVIPDLVVVEVIGVFLQVFGAVFVVNGLLMSISSIVEVKLKDERHVLIELTASMGRTLNTLESKIAKITKASETVQKCKYCGTELAEGNIFCPACGKSQK